MKKLFCYTDKRGKISKIPCEGKDEKSFQEDVNFIAERLRLENDESFWLEDIK